MAGYDPSEPRDPKSGKWASGGASGAAKGKSSSGGFFHKAAPPPAPKRAHRATGNPPGRPPKEPKRDRTQPVPPHPATTVPNINPKRGLTGDPHVDRQLANTAIKAGTVLATGVTAAAVGFGVRKLTGDQGGFAGTVGPNGQENLTGHNVFDPTVHRGPGRPRTTGPKPVPAVKFHVGFTAYRKKLG